MKIKLETPKEKPITLEVILQNERLKRGWNYNHVAEQLNDSNIDAKKVKRCEREPIKAELTKGKRR